MREPPVRQAGIKVADVDALVAKLAEIKVPTLVICGDEDQLTPPAVSQEMANAIPGARLAILEAAGHLSNIEQPAAFNAVLREFLTALPR